MATIEEIEQLVEEKHARARDAITFLKTYLSEDESTGPAAVVVKKPKNSASKPSKNGSATTSAHVHAMIGGSAKQGKVLEALKDGGWHTMTEIRDATGLSRTQIAGVMNSKKWRALFERGATESAFGEKRYRLKPATESKKD